MKNLSIVLAAAAAAFHMAGCQKDIDIFVRHEGSPCTLSVSLDESGTRVGGQTASNERKINDVQLFVFNRDTRRIDAALHKSVSGTDGNITLDELNCTRGTRLVWAIVNSPVNYIEGDNAVSTLDELQAVTTRLSDNRADNLIMAGMKELVLNADHQTIKVEVRRLAAAVYIKSIKNSMIVPAYQKNGSVRITGAYLMNVPNRQNFEISSDNVTVGSISAGSLGREDWISPVSKTANAAELALTSDTYAASSQVLAYNAEFAEHSTFYSYPNDIGNIMPGAVWKQSSTVLVVEAVVGGQACIYPVCLGALRNNYRYEVSLTLRHMGGNPDEPWRKIEFTDLQAAVTVVDWTTGEPVGVVI